MKKISLAIFTGYIFFTLTLLTADVKEKKSDDFLRINDNIQNDELRLELEDLRKEFDNEKKQIQKIYNKKIDALKEDRRNEMKTIKKDFSERRQILMKKYFGKIRKKPQMEKTKPVKNSQKGKKAQKKGVKKNRQP